MSADPVVGRVTFGPLEKLPSVPYRRTPFSDANRASFAAPLPKTYPHPFPLIVEVEDVAAAISLAFARLGDAPTLALIAVALQVRADEIAKGSSVEAQFLANDLARLGSQAKHLAETFRSMDA